MSTYGKLACDDEPSEQELQQESLAGASYYEYECAIKAEQAEQEHQQYMYVLSLGE